MKYQKNTLKIIEYLLSHKNRSCSIEEIIQGTGSGRSVAFLAIKNLERSGFIEFQEIGKQKLIKLNLDYYSLQYKYYLDAVELKSMSNFIKLILKIVAIDLYNKKKIDKAILFGSSLKSEDFNDLDILILGNNQNIKDFVEIRERIERVFEVILNFHFKELNLNNIFEGKVFYQRSDLNLIRDIEKQYLEFLDWALVAIKNQKNNQLFENAFNNALINLAYCQGFINDVEIKTKSEALSYLKDKYKIKNLTELKKTGVKIGEQIFK